MGLWLLVNGFWLLESDVKLCCIDVVWRKDQRGRPAGARIYLACTNFIAEIGDSMRS